MRKVIRLCLLLLFGCLIVLYSTNKTYALLTYEFLPNGDNYLDPANVAFIPVTSINNGKIRSISTIRVESDTEYFFYTIEYRDVEYGNALIEEFDNGHTKICDATLTRFEQASFIKFTTSENTEYISFEIMVDANPSAYLNLADIDERYLMTGYEVDMEDLGGESIPYEGAYYEGLEVMATNYTIETYISDPLEYDEIESSIFAYDITDGNITNNIQVITNTYEDSEYEVGEYSIVYRVTNSNNVSSQVNITVEIVDDIKPVISGDTTFHMYSTDLKTVEDIKAILSASDNIDGNITNSIEVDTDNFTNRGEVLGVTTIIFKVEDAANNITYHTVEVTVEQGDVTPPVFGGTSVFNVTTTTPMPIENILAQVTLSDDWDTNIDNSSIVVKINEYTTNTTKRGTYYIYLKATDSAGNIGTHTLTVNVKDMTAPVFVINPVIIYLPIEAKMKTVDELIVYLQKTDYVAEEAVVNVSYDEYSENKNTPGDYDLVLECDDVSLNICIKVIEAEVYQISAPEEVLNEKVTITQRINNLFNNVGSRIKSFFQSIFGRLFK